MSALARYLHSLGVSVSGYDRTQTPLTDKLIKEGIPVHFNEDPDGVPDNTDLVVYTPAIPSDHLELQYCLQNNLEVIKRSELLSKITESKTTIAIAGTHGKTTVSTMTAYLMRECGMDCSAFLGGIPVNYDTNFLAGRDDLIVVEADEYDRSFLRLTPDTALITSMDADHLDIYGNHESMQMAYREFAKQIKQGGLLFVNSNIENMSLVANVRCVSYGLNNKADCHGSGVRIENGVYRFDCRGQFGNIEDLTLNIGGMQNVENAIAALTIALAHGCEGDALRNALAGFRGVLRRFEYIIKNEKIVFIDDYAHHPTELRALISSARGLYPERDITIVFQPHLYSRTRDFASDFAKSLSLADSVFLLPIYPAREKPIPGVDSEMIFEEITSPRKTLCEKEEMLEIVKNENFEVLLSAGAGDISMMIEEMKTILEEKGL